MSTAIEISNVQQLAERFAAFNRDLIDFVESASPADWQAVTAAEGWAVGVTARHIGVAHYPLVEWVQMIVEGQLLPPVTMDTVDQLNAQHAQAHQGCTREEVLEILRANGANAQRYLNTLGDEDLARTSYLKLFDSEISAGDLFNAVLLEIAHGHLASMQAAVANNR